MVADNQVTGPSNIPFFTISCLLDFVFKRVVITLSLRWKSRHSPLSNSLSSQLILLEVDHSIDVRTEEVRSQS
jgi:hypothetical protein